MHLLCREESAGGSGRRGQVGIGTLVVFIAMVLVAAVAAGVLINTAAFLQATAEDAGKESVDRVVDGVEVVTAAGHVTPDANDNVENGTVETVRLWIRPRPAAGDIDVSELSVKWVGEHQAKSLSFSGSDPTAPSTAADAHRSFNASVGIGDGDAILETGEEFVLCLAASQIESALADPTNRRPLRPDGRITVEITVAGGSTSTVYLSVPDYTDDTSYVRL